MGVSADHIATIEAFVNTNKTKQLLLSDFRRQMLPAYDALVTDDKSPIYRYAKRAYFIIDKEGVVRWTVVNGLPDARDLNDYIKALDAI